MKTDSRGWAISGVMNRQYRHLMGYPRRQSVRYTEAENDDLLRAWLAGFSLRFIAERHQRGVAGVGIQLERLGAFPREASQVSFWACFSALILGLLGKEQGLPEPVFDEIQSLKKSSRE